MAKIQHLEYVLGNGPGVTGKILKMLKKFTDFTRLTAKWRGMTAEAQICTTCINRVINVGQTQEEWNTYQMCTAS